MRGCIVHDIQSGPFGHSIQYILEDNKIGRDFAHEDLAGAKEKLYHQYLRANTSYAGVPFQVETLCGERWAQVSSMIRGNGSLGLLISGTIDLDNIDNVVRLAFHAGICDPADNVLPIELARNIAPSPDRLVISDHTVPLVVRWQAIRKRLYEFLLLDWGEFSAKAMLTRAFEEAVRLEKVGTDNWRMTDDELIQYFLSQVGEAQLIKELSRRLRLGQLFIPVLIGRSAAIDTYRTLNRMDTKREIEKEIRKAAYRDRAGPQILVHFILDNKKTERAVEVILRETGERTVIGRDTQCLLIGAFASMPPTPKEATVLQAEAVRVFAKYGCGNIEVARDPLIMSGDGDGQLALFQ